MGKSGYFFEPTIILGAKKEMLITEEETFAPVLALYSFETEEEAVQAANNTSVSGIEEFLRIWLTDCRWDWLHTTSPRTLTEPGDFWRISKLAWLVWIQASVQIHKLKKESYWFHKGNSSAAESPFGGIKESGYGKESGKDVAINEYLITKTGTLTLDGHF
jgi:succinate-semialdehyde dehydrogenase/glutarate-semialdehyde dehydrogenase